MKSQFLSKIFTLTILASSFFIPLEAKAQSSYSYSQYGNGNEVLREYINRRREEVERLQDEIDQMRQDRILESLTY